jgi:hypothetical protein
MNYTFLLHTRIAKAQHLIQSNQLSGFFFTLTG